MILFNNNFSSPITKTILSEYFTTVTDPTAKIYPMATATTSGLAYTNASGSQVLPLLYQSISTFDINATVSRNLYYEQQANPQNFQIVTEKFLKVLDKVYTKIWNESFTETGIYKPLVLASLYSTFSNYSKYEVATQYYSNMFKFHEFVARCITAGILTEEDRLTSEDQIFISQFRSNLITNIDTTNNIITFSSNSVIDIKDFNTKEGSYLYGKKLYLLMTPYIANPGILDSTKVNTASPQTYFSHTGVTLPTGHCYAPWGFFKPKSPNSKFGSSVPLATHLFWRIGTPEDKEMALLEGTEVPEIIFDHLDRVSHIDTFQLKVKYGPIQFA